MISSRSFPQIIAYIAFCFSVLATGPVVAVGEEAEECCYYNPLQYARLEAGYSWGNFIGIDEDYAELGVFLPLILSKEGVIFFDARGYRFRESHWGSSIGLGGRKVMCNGDVLGVNVYYDNLESRLDKLFNRLSVGLEYLNACWDFRINGYFPVGKKNHNFELEVFTYPGGFIVTCQETEFSIGQGFDAEIGKPLICCCDFRVYGAVGPYFYNGNKNDNIWGGYARIEATLNEYLSIRVRSSYDKTYRSRTQVSAFLTLPFDALCCWRCCKDCCLNLLTQPVRRDGVIFTDSCCTYTNVNFRNNKLQITQ